MLNHDDNYDDYDNNDDLDLELNSRQLSLPPLPAPAPPLTDTRTIATENVRDPGQEDGQACVHPWIVSPGTPDSPTDNDGDDGDEDDLYLTIPTNVIIRLSSPFTTNGPPLSPWQASPPPSMNPAQNILSVIAFFRCRDINLQVLCGITGSRIS